MTSLSQMYPAVPKVFLILIGMKQPHVLIPSSYSLAYMFNYPFKRRLLRWSPKHAVPTSRSCAASFAHHRCLPFGVPRLHTVQPYSFLNKGTATDGQYYCYIRDGKKEGDTDTGSISRSQMRKPSGSFLCSSAEQHNTGKERERPVAGKGKGESGNLNQYCIERGVLVIEDWKPKNLGSNITWDCPVNIIGIPFFQLKNVQIGLDWL